MSDTHSTQQMIRSAFASAPRPTELREIAPHECPECDELASDLRAFDAETLPSGVIEYHAGDLPLLSRVAVRHYLAAWLVHALQHPECGVIEYTIFHLTPSASQVAADSSYWRDRFLAFTDEQRRAVAAFFAVVRANDLWEAFDGEFERADVLWGPQRP